MKIELGCGPDHDPEYFGIDLEPFPGVDLVWDLEEMPLPLEDRCCNEIVSSHVLEHIQNLIPLMNECHRLLEPGGLFRASFPQVCDSQGQWHAAAFQDPTHLRFFVPATWYYFVEDHPLYHFGRMYGIAPWKLMSFVDEGWAAALVLIRPEGA